MKIPAFIKQLVKFCDTESSRYALGCIEAKSLNGVAQLTATDGRMLANVYWQDDGPAMDVLVNGKQLASPPAAAFKDKKGVEFDGSTLTYGTASLKPEPCDGRFPRYEDVFTIHDKPEGYVAVKLDASLLKVLAELAGAVSSDMPKPSVCLWVKDTQSAVFAAAHSASGHTARLAQMPLAADDIKEYGYPPRPGAVPAEEEQPAPPPEMLDDDAIAEAVTREPEPMVVAGVMPEPEEVSGIPSAIADCGPLAPIGS